MNQVQHIVSPNLRRAVEVFQACLRSSRYDFTRKTAEKVLNDYRDGATLSEDEWYSLRLPIVQFVGELEKESPADGWGDIWISKCDFDSGGNQALAGKGWYVSTNETHSALQLVHNFDGLSDEEMDRLEEEYFFLLADVIGPLNLAS